MRLPDPIANTTTEAYLAYKAGVLEVGDLKPVLYDPYLHFDAWLAYWCGLTNTYPLDNNNEPEMLTDEEAIVAYLSGVTDTYPEEIKDPYDVRIVGYLKYLVSVKYGRPDYPVTNEEFYLSMLMPPYVTNDTPSTDIALYGTADYKFLDLKMYGDATQQTYTGKNLCGPAAWRAVATSAGYPLPWQSAATIVSGDDNSVVFNVPATYGGAESCFIPVKAGETYTVSFGGDNLPNRLFITQYDSSKTRVSTLNPSSVHQVVTTTVTTTDDGYIAVAFAATTTAGTYGASNIQVEKGSIATSYEPYVGGIPAPNPNYPQPVNSVTGQQAVTVSGKNLRPNLEITQAGSVYRSDNSRYFLLKAGRYTVSYATDSTAANIRPLFYVQDLSRTQVTSGDVFVAGDGIYYDNSWNGWGVHSGRATEQSFTLADDYYVQVVLANFDSATSSATDMQVEEGSTATDYVPYENTAYPVDLASRNLCTDVSLPYENTLRLDFNKMPTNKFTVTFTTNELLLAASVRLFTLDPEYHNFGIVGNISGVAGGTATAIVTLDDTTYTQLKSAMSKGSPSYITIYKNGANFTIPSDAQIETGATATPYEPYYEPIELYKIGDYQDYIYKDGDAWMLHREIKKVVLDGTEQWGGSGHVFQTSASRVSDVEDRSKTALSDSFKWAYYQSAITQNIKNGEFGWNASKELTVRYDDITGYANFKTWLTTHNVAVYYKNTEETDTEIINSVIVAQLDAIVDGGSSKDATYIKVTANEPNIAGALTVIAGKE